mgnify:CR=1 FL=1
MKVKYSKDADALLIELSTAAIDYATEAGPFIMHFSKKGKLALIEVLDASKTLREIVQAIPALAPKRAGQATASPDSGRSMAVPLEAPVRRDTPLVPSPVQFAEPRNGKRKTAATR